MIAHPAVSLEAPFATAPRFHLRKSLFWPAVMILLTAASLAGVLVDPGHRWIWFYLPYTLLGNSLMPLPFDGYVIALGQQHPIWTVVVLGVLGTVIVEAWNMELLSRLLAQEKLRNFRNHRLTRWSLRMYGAAPFLALVGTCVLPIIPHYPMRVLAALAKYPMWKYQLSVILGRGGRYLWLALLGWSIPIPVEWIAVASLGFLLLGLRGARRMNRSDLGDEIGDAA